MTFVHATETDVIVFFVQNSQNIEYDAGTVVLILKHVGPTTIWFTDRPERMAGHETVQSFVGDWGKGKDSFAANPPNATLSVFEGDQVQDAVVVLSNPRLICR